MNLVLCLITLGTLPGLHHAWKPFKASERAPSVIDEGHSISQMQVDVNPTKLLESSRQQPSFYAAAMLEIKRLEEKPICHRMAAQLLVKNCQDMKDLRVHEYQMASDHMQRHHVETFAAALAMCDMDRARFDIPDACHRFRSNALEDALRSIRKLEVSPQDVSRCLEGLGQDHSLWSTWLSYRDTSLLLCRGASVDVGKDQAIEFHKKFVQMMEQFTTELFDDMLLIRRQMVDYARDSSKAFEKVLNKTETWGMKFHKGLEKLSQDLKHTDTAVKSIIDGTESATRMIRKLVNTMIQSNAELAAEQEVIVSTASNLLHTNLGEMSEQVRRSEIKLVHLQDIIVRMATEMTALIERHDAIEKSSQHTLNTLNNITEAVQSHQQTLERASMKASRISDELDRVAANASNMESKRSALDWVIRTTIPMISLFGGNFKTDTTTMNNLVLLSVGYFVGESINFIRHFEWNLTWASRAEWLWQFFSNTTIPHTFAKDSSYQTESLNKE